jgi:serine/threonine-protein kinase
LGHYRLLEQIGGGGMGVVFRARDEQLQRDVALKILPTGMLVDDDARRQFRQEALAIGKLNHPNIAMAFDFGQENGVDYLVTEYVPGSNLDQRIARQPLPQKTVLELGLQLASGLEAAHRQNVIHRDLKPSNLRINPAGQLKILDFGLAKLIGPVDEDAETANLTSELGLSGTMPYMAPELLRSEPADARSDIWAAGAVLYEMATGKRAFPERQPSMLIEAILHFDPMRPSVINPKVTPPLEAVILRALERDPNRRYQSAQELLGDLNRIVAGDELSTATLRRTNVLKVERKARRSRIALIAGVLLAGIVVGYLVKRWWPQPFSHRQRILAVLPLDTVGQDPATSALGMGLMETLTAKLVQASDGNSIQVVSPRDLRDQGVKTAEDARRAFGTDFVLESSLQSSGPTIRVNCYLVDSRTHGQIAARSFTVDTSDTFGLQDRVVSETLDMLPSQLKLEQRRQLNVHRDTQPAAYEAYIRGRGYLQEFNKPEDIDSAIAEFVRATKIDPNYALGYAALGNTYLTGFQEFSKGNDWIASASRNCEKALQLNPELVEGHICLGRLYNGTGKYDKAVEEFQRAVQAEPTSEDALRGLADVYTNLNNFSSAEATYKKAIALRPNYWGVYNWLGAFYFGQNRYSDAAAAFLQSTRLAPDNYFGYFNLGGAYVAEGRYQEAIDAFKRSLDLRPSLDAYGNLGYTYTLMHRFPEAIAALQQALKINDSDWLNWGNLGDALYWSGDRRSEAAAAYRKAIAIARSKLEVNPQDDYTLGYLADYSAMVEDRPAALDYLQRAMKVAPKKGEVQFRAAIVYNHFKQTDQALVSLKKAVDAGYSRSTIRDTPDFAGLQQNQQFRAIVGPGP